MMILFECLNNQTIGGVVVEAMLFMGPVWIALLTGIFIGWVWKPKWVDSGRDKLGCSASKDPSSSSSPSVLMMGILEKKKQVQGFGFDSWASDDGALNETASADGLSCSSPELEKPAVVTREDVQHLCRLVEVKDGGPAWMKMMDRSTPTMTYQAWRRDPETGPPEYRSSTVYEDVTPELMRDFFWDDEFRAKWDDMLVYGKTLEECPTTGTMVVQWVRKFPFFCSDREYIIGRRIWESGRSYYCVTKGVPTSAVPRQNKPRRVDMYYSSWCIRAVESKRGDGQLTACEVLLFHHEDMGIPWEIAKLGVRQGMWGLVKKIERGLHAYKKHRASGAPLSRCAFMAQINTKLNADYMRALESTSDSPKNEALIKTEKKQSGDKIPKLLVVGGAIVLACSIDRGLLTKAVIFGVARRFGNFGRQM